MDFVKDSEESVLADFLSIIDGTNGAETEAVDERFIAADEFLIASGFTWKFSLAAGSELFVSELLIIEGSRLLTKSVERRGNRFSTATIRLSRAVWIVKLFGGTLGVGDF